MLEMALGTRDEVSLRLFLDKAWHAFVSDGIELDGVDPEILRSWRRARDTFGVDPALRRCPRLLTPADLAGRRERDDVHRLALPVLQEFGTRLAPTRHVLAYFDPAGWMLSMNGDPRVAEMVAEINFSPGANWSEASVGTNGPARRWPSGSPSRCSRRNTTWRRGRPGRAPPRPSSIRARTSSPGSWTSPARGRRTRSRRSSPRARSPRRSRSG